LSKAFFSLPLVPPPLRRILKLPLAQVYLARVPQKGRKRFSLRERLEAFFPAIRPRHVPFPKRFPSIESRSLESAPFFLFTCHPRSFGFFFNPRSLSPQGRPQLTQIIPPILVKPHTPRVSFFPRCFEGAPVLAEGSKRRCRFWLPGLAQNRVRFDYELRTVSEKTFFPTIFPFRFLALGPTIAEVFQTALSMESRLWRPLPFLRSGRNRATGSRRGDIFFSSEVLPAPEVIPFLELLLLS